MKRLFLISTTFFILASIYHLLFEGGSTVEALTKAEGLSQLTSKTTNELKTTDLKQVLTDPHKQVCLVYAGETICSSEYFFRSIP